MPNIIPRLDQPVTVEPAPLLTTTPIQAHEKQNGALFVFNSATSIIVNLPPPRKGLWFQFYVKVAAGSGVGHLVHPTSTARVLFKGVVSPLAGKGVMNTQATSALGDSFYLEGDGTDWLGYASAGTWAREI